MSTDGTPPRAIYADNNATTPVAPEVFEALTPFLTEDFYNPSSSYEASRSSMEAIAGARRTVARCLGGVEPREVLFTSCATESNNAAIAGVVKANPSRRHVITTAVEHPAVLEVCKDLERQGLEVTFLPVDRDGNLDPAEFVRSLRTDTLLVTVMHANNETGVVFPIERLSRLTKETDPTIVFHTDATQTVGKLPIDLTAGFRHVDLLSLSGHKLYAPKGVGALFLRKGTRCRPLLLGGHQEDGRRGGTENVAFIVGLARALEIVVGEQATEEPRVQALRDRMERAFEERIPYVQINGKHAPRMPNTTNVSCHFIEGEGILYQLSEFRICASSGSACTSGSLEPSHVMRAMDIPFTAAHGSVRFSLGRYNTDEDVDRIVEVFPEIVANLRKLSPYWDVENDRPRPEAEAMIES
jgi:cysteine desulfurase